MKIDQIEMLLLSFGVQPHKSGSKYRLYRYDGGDGSDQRAVNHSIVRGKDAGLFKMYANGSVGADDRIYTLCELRVLAKKLENF